MISSCYKGPSNLSSDAITALKVLNDCLSIEINTYTTHSVLTVDNFDNKYSLEATAIYLVSAISQNIESNLKIREALFNEASISRELNNDVLSVIGEEGANKEFKINVRDPWVWEGISHMLNHLAKFNPNFHPSGHVLAKTSIKYNIHDHGLDVIVIYESNVVGISAGECKAYLKDPTRGIIDASNQLAEIDNNLRDVEIRAAVNQLRSALSEDDKEKLSGAFWQDERSYMPFICCDNDFSCDWTRNRNPLKKLSAPVNKKFLFPLPLSEIRKKFDKICHIMRIYTSKKE